MNNNHQKSKPKVSLLLMTFNCKENLIGTLSSIEQQDYENLEVVIKDGGSIDGTLDTIKAYAESERLNIIWTTGRDNGIYDALNQGYQLSTGEIIACFNDRFMECSAISKLVSIITESEGFYQGAHADLVYARGNQIVRYWHMGEGDIRQGWMPGHPTLFLKREVYETYGLYNVNYKCSADYEFIVRILKDNRINLAYIDEVLISMYYGGTSSNNWKSYLLSFKEAYQALKENRVPFALWINLRRTIKVIKQFCNKLRR